MPFIDTDKVRLFAMVEQPKRPDLAHLNGPHVRRATVLPFVSMSLNEMKCRQDLEHSGALEIMPGVYLGAYMEKGAMVSGEIVTPEEKGRQLKAQDWWLALSSVAMFAAGFVVGVAA